MIELIVERWTSPGGGESFMWSVWRDGKRVGMGRPQGAADLAETEGGQWCWRELKHPPDRVTRL